YELEALETEYFEAIEFLKGFNLVDCEYQINQHISENHSILAEGAQGSLLDIDFGTYPFVTSSNTMTAGACTGLGVAPKHIGKVYGIFKAYCTRVGSGPFPTELQDEVGEKMRKVGNEFGSTTGRPRRCGWLDLPALKYAVMLNGVSELLMMKADVLNDFDELKICTHYKTASGELVDYLPYDINTSAVTPVYKTMKGWKCATSSFKSFEDLTPAFKEYVSFIENYLNLPITLISLGPDRTETIIK
ncbi:MAG: adenylosuccinate synthetase, partial [Cytophagales bacterium]|nr:adenylosuccinate synthetase [Cytophagales bacterium]